MHSPFSTDELNCLTEKLCAVVALGMPPNRCAAVGWAGLGVMRDTQQIPIDAGLTFQARQRNALQELLLGKEENEDIRDHR